MSQGRHSPHTVLYSVIGLLLSGCQDASAPTGPSSVSAAIPALAIAPGGSTLLIGPPARPNNAALDGHRVVWADLQTGNWEIFAQELATGTRTRITSATTTEDMPDVSGDRVVWTSLKPNVSWNIFLYDFASGAERQITFGATGGRIDPRIDGDRIVWSDQRFATNDVFMFDLSTNTERTITALPGNQTHPAISGDWIVWEDSRTPLSNHDIYAFNVVTSEERALAVGTPSQLTPDIDGSRVVWTDHRHGNAEIYMHDLETGVETRITTNAGPDDRASISGDVIVWSGVRSGQSDVFAYDISDGITTTLTPITGHQTDASVSGRHIIWEDLNTQAIHLHTIPLAPTNEAPVADAGGPYAGLEGSAIGFDGSGSSDADGDALELTWDFGDGTSASGFAPSHTYGDNGTYTVTITVSDGTLSTQATTVAEIGNAAPVLGALSGPDESVPVNTTVTLSASFTDAGILDGHSVRMDWGDNLSTAGTITATNGASSVSWNRAYASAGVYTVTLTVTDDDGAAAQSQRAVSVHAVNAAPVVEAGLDRVVAEGSSVGLAGASFTDPDSPTHSASIAWGDGQSSPIDPASGSLAASHVYADDGTFTATLCVADDAGLQGCDAITVTVTNVAPLVSSFAGAVLIERETYNSSGTFADPGADSWTASFTYGQGEGTSTLGLDSRSFALEHQYRTPGSYTVTASVSDDDGGSGSAQASVTVQSYRTAINELLVGSVDGLLASGRISEHDAARLTRQIESALARYQAVDLAAYPQEVTKGLNAYIADVDWLVAHRRLAAADGATLVASANRIIKAINTP